jgi:hypothetical protein
LFVWKSKHAPLQLFRPGAHWHVPDWQVKLSVTSQVVPHAPQLVLLVCVSVQIPLQRVWVPGHRQAPASQKLPP